MTDRSLAVVYPALNEEACIARAVTEAASCGRRLAELDEIDRFEVVVVDDGSTDRTAEVLAALARDLPNLVVVRHTANRGLGAAVRSGLAAVTADLAFYTDADLPVDLDLVDRSLALLRDRGADVVSAYRLGRGGEGPRRFVYSFAYNALIRVAFGLRVRDVNFAAKLFRMQALDGVELHSEGSFIDAEVLARVDRRGGSIVQLPAVYHPRSRGVSTLSSFAVIRTILSEMRSLASSIRQERPRVPAT